jgi:HAMP domain-containing protein
MSKMKANSINRMLIGICLLWTTFWLQAQPEVEMADDFRGEGKIYVVVGVILLILIGVFIQLFRLERKIKKMEEEN